MTTIAVQHPVQDFDTWLTTFQAHESTRASYGGGPATVYPCMGPSGDVLVLLNWSSPEEFQRFMAESDIKAVMEKAGVTAQPQITVFADPMTPSVAASNPA